MHLLLMFLGLLFRPAGYDTYRVVAVMTIDEWREELRRKGEIDEA